MAYERIPSVVTTYSGLSVDPLDLQPEDILIEDIAHHLAMQCRWTGAVKHHYSVAQHAWHCSYLVPKPHAYDALHHDDPEWILQDMVKPLKSHEYFGQAYRGLERRVEKIIGPVLEVNFPCSPEVKTADLLMRCTEADQLVHGRPKHWPKHLRTLPAADLVIPKWTPEKAKKKWLARHEQLSRSLVATVE